MPTRSLVTHPIDNLHTRKIFTRQQPQHNSTVKLPKGDVLSHAGDLTNQGSYSEVGHQPPSFPPTLDHACYAQHGHAFHSQQPQSSTECLDLLRGSPSITYLHHESATIRLRPGAGPATQFTVFGSPYSPRHGRWAFGYDASAHADGAASPPTTNLWHDIAPDTDIVVTHTPPRNHGDATGEQRPRGCEALRRALWRVRPRLAVCGYIHDGRGVRRVVWDTNPGGSSRFAEKSVSVWTDPGVGNNKLSLVDLTAKKGPSLAKGETCMVNAAILKTSYPHREGKQLNKPIVVDVDFPVWVAE
ncbi:hypothetical protein E4U41_000277 [Claviceps citrina]|nr:hypothetical protein E4U41_000277 [Claviceps citrina]